MWVDKGCKFCNRCTKSWWLENSIETHYMGNEGKSVASGVVPLIFKKGSKITNTFQNFTDETRRCVVKSKGCKPSKIWFDKGKEFCNRSMKLWLQENSMEMNSRHDEGESVAAERFIGTLKE